jgi:type IV secretion system protein VirB10
MPVEEIGDSRLQTLFGTTDPRDRGARPTVRLPRRGLPPFVLAGIAVIVALLLFAVLNNRRTQHSEPSVSARAADGATQWTAPPPLYIPPVPQQIVTEQPAEEHKAGPDIPAPAPASPPRVATSAAPVMSVAPQPPTVSVPASPVAQRTSSGTPLVIDTGGSTNSATSSQPGGSSAVAAGAGQGVIRMRASAFANRSMTVPQGHLIPAVLETGFDSTKPGFARAIVSRDVRGFDGKNVLIPRGSRLIGEYDSAVGQGQNRAVINWTRLIRPDGMTIALDSPAVDTVGRGGVPASVNSHFFTRVGNALLQSTFAIGQALSGRSTTGPVLVLQGNGANAATQLATPPTNLVPTLKVRPGKSISVFVAQDLDFSSAGDPK